MLLPPIDHTKVSSRIFDAVHVVTERAQPTRDLLVPFTTSQLTRVALDEAIRLAKHLTLEGRVVRVQVVPNLLPLDSPSRSRASPGCQIANFRPENAVRFEVPLAHYMKSLLAAIHKDSAVIILAVRRGVWPSKTVSLAKTLRGAGYTVILVSEKET
jgi:hypothetical protein